jgi:hypothetical protein
VGPFGGALVVVVQLVVGRGFDEVVELKVEREVALRPTRIPSCLVMAPTCRITNDAHKI